jgi:hypothetical protein
MTCCKGRVEKDLIKKYIIELQNHSMRLSNSIIFFNKRKYANFVFFFLLNKLDVNVLYRIMGVYMHV